MTEIMDMKAQVFSQGLIGGPSVYEVLVTEEGTDHTHYRSPVWYRDRIDAEAEAERINSALFADKCDTCGAPSDFIEDIGNLARDVTDITSWCSDGCRAEAQRELAALEMMGL